MNDKEIIQRQIYDGFLEKTRSGTYEGNIIIEGIDLSPITGIYFKENGKFWLWLKRKDKIDYDFKDGTYTKRVAVPYWECYLEKQPNGRIAYKGFFIFCHFKYSIVGMWDKYMKDKDRINFYIERLPQEEQTIINNIKSKQQ